MGAYGLYELHVKAKAREQTSNRKPWAKNAIFPPPHDKILTANGSEKEHFSVYRQINHGHQTAKPTHYYSPPLFK